MYVLDRVLSVLLALVLVVVGVLVPLEVVRALLGDDGSVALPYERAAAFLRDVSWDDPAVVTTAAVVAVVGLLLLLLELVRRGPGLLALTGDSDEVVVGTSRASLARALRVAAESVGGVGSARARVTRRSAAVVATTSLRDPAGLEDEVRGRVTALVDGLGLVRAPSVRVRLQQKER